MNMLSIAAGMSFALASPASARVVYFRVEGIKTEACARNVEAILKSAQGVTATKVNRKLGLVLVEQEGKAVSVQQLAEKLSVGDGKHPPHPAVPISDASAKALMANAQTNANLAPSRSKPESDVLYPWDPIDETFRGCEGGCGMRGEDPRAIVQPGAAIGQRTYCPVSGVVFEVNVNTPRAVVDGKALYFCCEGCARHFAVARDEVLGRRQLASGK